MICIILCDLCFTYDPAYVSWVGSDLHNLGHMPGWEPYDPFALLRAHVSWVESDLRDLDHVAEGRSRMICML